VKQRSEHHTTSRRTFIRMTAVAVPVGALALGGVAWYARPAGSRSPAGTAIAGRARRETRPTLDPARFVGKPAQAHRVARAIPDVLDDLYCYCECDKSIGHTSLLSCYTDGHAAT
jgi:hypothetical protein